MRAHYLKALLAEMPQLHSMVGLFALVVISHALSFADNAKAGGLASPLISTNVAIEIASKHPPIARKKPTQFRRSRAIFRFMLAS